MPRAWSLLLCLPLCSTACDSTDDTVKKAEAAARDASQKAVDASKQAASDLADDAAEKAKTMGNDAVDASKKAAAGLANDAVDASKKAAAGLADATASKTREWVDDLRNDGELSTTAKAWIAEQASGDSIETFIGKGAQLAPAAMEASRVLHDAVDSETALEPIYQEIDGDTSEVDAAIGDMPRTEVVDGVTLGFRQLDKSDNHEKVKERGYLVMWRHEDHLVGFVYRSKRTIDIDQLVAQAPRLYALTQGAVGG